MIRIDRQRAAAELLPAIDRVFDVSARKIRALDDTWRAEDGAPVFTVGGRYKSRGWTEWTQGFQFGMPLLQFDATGDRQFLELGRARTLERMAPHLTHTGVHDHGFNNISTYGNLWRLAREGRFAAEAWELRLYALALRVTGAVQATLATTSRASLRQGWADQSQWRRWATSTARLPCQTRPASRMNQA